MAGDSGLASQVFALAKDIGKVEKDIKALSERNGDVQTALDQLSSVQEALDHLEERTSGLHGELAPIRGELAPLRAGLDALGKKVKQVVEDLEAIASRPEEKLAVWNWSFDNGMDREEAGEAWETLVRWVRSELLGTYGWVGWPADMFAKTNPTGYGSVGGPVTASRIPPCWYRHRDAVAELSGLCQEWIKIYRTSYGTPSRALDWHDRYAPNAKKRIINALIKCVEKGAHVDEEWINNPNHPDNGAPRATDDDEILSGYIEWDRQHRREPPAAGPVAAN
ncbi:hypothetical protein PV735_46710 [Streptomyces turgidiscabies]|uniref:Uncharacterized protein n=1 Tax=Streptomyces turgidiscabies (strain Car8) TaxID=698760 RepID=L7F0V1_STRT8|nr:hypothetical protein [Streptomyces turgidiscabies]ELP64210.1 hypothetical protein STRTUCAR8_00051 [Streptomyces turgidiscabies Car8]MDX3500113.1 hypothetical protein [Streptomyces turgidiscabies]GAQ77195.1 hypothetical protein T45_09011 [Streptomyces turgidiscabies]